MPVSYDPGVGFFDSITDAYDRADRSVDRVLERAAKKALDIAVPKKDRKLAKELGLTADRFAGMIASNAPNTKEAPSFVSMMLEPFREAKKNPTPWNIYAAGAGLAGVFPWKTNRQWAKGEEWDMASGKGKIRNTGDEKAALFKFVPAGRDEPDYETYNQTTFHEPRYSEGPISYLHGLYKSRDAPGDVAAEMVYPLIDRFDMTGAKIDTHPVNTVVAGSLLRHQVRKPGIIHEDAERLASLLLDKRLQQLTRVRNADVDEMPWLGAADAGTLRRMLVGDQQTPTSFGGALKGFERWMQQADQYERTPEPGFKLPDFADRKNPAFRDLMDKIQDPDYWENPNAESSGISVPRSMGATFGEPVPAGRPRDRTPAPAVDPYGSSMGEGVPAGNRSMIAAQYEARGQHTMEEWNRLPSLEREGAIGRASRDVPARIRDYALLAHRTQGEMEEGQWEGLSFEEREAAMRAYRDRSSVDSATNAVMDAIYPNTELSRQFDRGNFSAESRRRASGVPDDLNDPDLFGGSPAAISTSRNMERFGSNAVMRVLDDRGTISDRAVAMAMATPDWPTLSNTERVGESRRIRRQIAHAEQSGDDGQRLRAFQRQEARESMPEGEFDEMLMSGQELAVNRGRIGLPYRLDAYIRMRAEARDSDPTYDPDEFDELPNGIQMGRVARFWARRRLDEPQ
jgi:hypothetical protein